MCNSSSSSTHSYFLRFAVVSVVMLACGDDPVDPPQPVPVSVEVDPAAITLASIGETAQLAATVLDQDGQVIQGLAVAWSSGNPTVATVDASGLVTAAGNGSATITASSGSATGTASVTVAQEAVGVSVSPDALSFASLGDTARLIAAVVDANGAAVEGAAVEWTTEDATVATVDASGLVTAAGNGSATITASSGSATGTASVTVAQEAAGVSVSPGALSFASLGDTARLAAAVVDANGAAVEGAEVEWTTEDATVATVDLTGLVTTVGNGNTTVKATSGSTTDTTVVVVKQKADTVIVSPASLSFTLLGFTAQLTATVVDANGTLVEEAAPVLWTTADSTVATVNPSGLVMAVGNGTTTITATSSSFIPEGPGWASGSVPVTVATQQADDMSMLTAALSFASPNDGGHFDTDDGGAWDDDDQGDLPAGASQEIRRFLESRKTGAIAGILALRGRVEAYWRRASVLIRPPARRSTS